ncbi:SDR family NAD(P)-dependent oxidoreductase [Saccharopolyspora spinosporotrichia]
MSRRALVTGASSGIGAAVAAALVERGYRVTGTSRDPAAVENPVPGVDHLPLDLTDDASIEACAAAAGEVDVLVNNAGESQSGPFEELPAAAIQRVFQLNVFGAVRLTQLLLPGMRARGRGRVVVVGSMPASFPLAFRSSYVASKAAIKGFASAARRELSPYGIAVTTVEPGRPAPGSASGGRSTSWTVRRSPTSTARWRPRWMPTSATGSPLRRWRRPSCARSSRRVRNRTTRWAATHRSCSPCAACCLGPSSSAWFPGATA